MPYDYSKMNTARDKVDELARDYQYGDYTTVGKTILDALNGVQACFAQDVVDDELVSKRLEVVKLFAKTAPTGEPRKALKAYIKAVDGADPDALDIPSGEPSVGQSDVPTDLTPDKPKKKRKRKLSMVLLAAMGLCAFSATTRAQLSVDLPGYTQQQTYCIENVLGRYHGQLVEFVWRTTQCVPRVRNPRPPRDRTFIAVEEYSRRNVLDQNNLVVIYPLPEYPKAGPSIKYAHARQRKAKTSRVNQAKSKGWASLRTAPDCAKANNPWRGDAYYVSLCIGPKDDIQAMFDEVEPWTAIYFAPGVYKSDKPWRIPQSNLVLVGADGQSLFTKPFYIKGRNVKIAWVGFDTDGMNPVIWDSDDYVCKGCTLEEPKPKIKFRRASFGSSRVVVEEEHAHAQQKPAAIVPPEAKPLVVYSLPAEASKDYVELDKIRAELVRQLQSIQAQQFSLMTGAGIPKSEHNRQPQLTKDGIVIFAPPVQPEAPKEK